MQTIIIINALLWGWILVIGVVAAINRK